MSTTRAKFRVNSVTFLGDHTDPNTTRRYELSAIYDTSTPENARFTKATPWADLKMTVDNPNAVLTVHKEYYLDITPVEEAQALMLDEPPTSEALANGDAYQAKHEEPVSGV